MTDVDASNVMELVLAEQRGSGARVELLTEESHNFGVMAPGDKGSHVFRIKNVGTEDLKLKKGASTCKCTIGSFDSDVVKPGEETEIHVSWTVNTGKNTFSQQAQVITNDPLRVVLDFKIDGDVVRDIEFSPRAVQFDEVAAGESFEVNAKMYSFYDNEIEVGGARFSSEQMDKLADIEITPFDPTEDDAEFAKAKKGYDIKAKVKPGLRQGAVSTTMLLDFKVRDDEGNFVYDDDEIRKPLIFTAEVSTTGFIAGPLSMVENAKIKSAEGGYIVNLGKQELADSKKTIVFIKLKGSERHSTKLTIGGIEPAEAIKAKLGKPSERGATVVYPLELEIIPGDKPIDLTGKSKDDYGTLWIQSDNPKVPKMLIGVKFAIDAKP